MIFKRKRFNLLGLYKNALPMLCLFMMSNMHAQKSYQLINSDGIFIEKFDSSVKSDNRFTSDNIIYKEKGQYVFDYVYTDSLGRKFLQEILSEREQNQSRKWRLIPYDEKNKQTLTKFRLTVLGGLQGFDRFDPDYAQSIIKYDYFSDSAAFDFSENTGLVENEKNIWFHPPRVMLFRILELNPFPFIMFPPAEGDSWEWDLKIGDPWGDERWRKWQGLIENKISYSVDSTELIETSFGELTCTKIVAKAKSRLGESCLTAFYHTKLGFVRLLYKNINNSCININLVTYREL